MNIREERMRGGDGQEQPGYASDRHVQKRRIDRTGSQERWDCVLERPRVLPHPSPAKSIGRGVGGETVARAKKHSPMGAETQSEICHSRYLNIPSLFSSYPSSSSKNHVN